MNRPQVNEYPKWADVYISLVKDDIIITLEKQVKDFVDFINSLIDKGDYAYAEGKWTIKQLVGHIIDTERILAYRMLCFVRGDKNALPGFDEDAYVSNAHFQDRSLFSLGEEFAAMRTANLYLIKSLNEEELDRAGIANGLPITPRALAYFIAGHLIHHKNVIEERYL